MHILGFISVGINGREIVSFFAKNGLVVAMLTLRSFLPLGMEEKVLSILVLLRRGYKDGPWE